MVEGILRRLVAGADPPQFWQARLREFNEYFVLAKAPPGGSAELNQTTLHWARVPTLAGGSSLPSRHRTRCRILWRPAETSATAS